MHSSLHHSTFTNIIKLKEMITTSQLKAYFKIWRSGVGQVFRVGERSKYENGRKEKFLTPLMPKLAPDEGVKEHID